MKLNYREPLKLKEVHVKGCFKWIQKKELCLARWKGLQRKNRRVFFLNEGFQATGGVCAVFEGEYLAEDYTGNRGGREGTWELPTVFRGLSVGPMFPNHFGILADFQTHTFAATLGCAVVEKAFWVRWDNSWHAFRKHWRNLWRGDKNLGSRIGLASFIFSLRNHRWVRMPFLNRKVKNTHAHLIEVF